MNQQCYDGTELS